MASTGERITVRVPDAPGWGIVRAIDGDGWDVHGPNGLATWRRYQSDAVAAAQLLCARAALDEALDALRPFVEPRRDRFALAKAEDWTRAREVYNRYRGDTDGR